MAPQSGPQTYTSIADSAAVKATNRHAIYSWDHSPGHMLTRPLLMAPETRPQTTRKGVPCGWRRSRGHRPTRPLEMAPQCRPDTDTPHADSVVVHVTGRHVLWR
jgi:hypothetical protein